MLRVPSYLQRRGCFSALREVRLSSRHLIYQSFTSDCHLSIARCSVRQTIYPPHPQRCFHTSSAGKNTSFSAKQEDTFESSNGWYDSHDSRHKSNHDRSPSTRDLFQKIPIQKPILSYIESIGVGIRPRTKRARKKVKSSKRSGSMDNGISLLSEAEEKDFFDREGLRSGVSERKHSRGNSEIGKKRSGRSGPGIENQKDTQSSFWWLPPPPFASNCENEPREESTGSGHKIIRRPVKVLGKAGSLNDDMPRSSSGLPEVALAGRSNVGKSTLLNALLYGNQPSRDGHSVERMYQRGKTPERMKLPRGEKAKVSDKPGETQDITLYQLSSDMVFLNKEGQRENKSKMSLVLADLPGYGFAYASENKATTWSELMKHYLLRRGESLKRILLLIDARHGFKNADYAFLETLQNALKEGQKKGAHVSSKQQCGLEFDLPPIQIVLTKCDLCKQDDLARRVVQVKEQLSKSLKRQPSSLPVMLVSAKTGVGYNNIRRGKARGGMLQLQRELAALVPFPDRDSHK